MKKLHWILQDFEDMRKLSDALDRFDMPYSYHKVVPFIGELQPHPEIQKNDDYLLFGSYTLWRYAEKYNLKPGVFKLQPYIFQNNWQKYLVNTYQDSLLLRVYEIPENLSKLTNQDFFIRPVDDSKEFSGCVKNRDEIIEMCQKVLALNPDEYIGGSLNPNTMLLLSSPVKIIQEYRIWIVNNSVVTHSTYKIGSRVVYSENIDQDVLVFAEKMITLNFQYSDAYVMDIARLADGSLKILETNCINAAGFYAADTQKIVIALSDMILS